MKKICSNLPNIIIFLFGIFHIFMTMLDWLGGLDTVCNVFGAEEKKCGSRVLINYLLNPPIWVFTVGILWLTYQLFRERKFNKKKMDETLIEVKKSIRALEGKFTLATGTIEKMQDRLTESEKLILSSVENSRHWDKLRTAGDLDAMYQFSEKMKLVTDENWKLRGEISDRIDAIEKQINRFDV